ncbi:general stress protein [Salicibibacter halophilus]|uniref:General stress protein n=1 Tax=Salicibibacter halophilus TaxID=2502791 RepID=A0A514LGE0_9BACI|nr:general stress protein [Salicibibacter halophilus]QDI90916.1 general stress protein [Salicibibacter halophilus]
MQKPMFKEFMSDDEAVRAIEKLKMEVNTDNIYVITHDDGHTDRVADRTDANTVGIDETGFGVSIKNIFRNKGDELRAKLQELGFTEEEAEHLESQLDKGEVIVAVTEAPEGVSIKS